MNQFDMDRALAEHKWLQKNPDFEQRPATIEEFITAPYLNIEGRVRPAIMTELIKIIGSEVSSDRMTDYPEAMITGGIGIGKTTIASIVLPWLVHWVLCLRDPQEFFNLLPGSRIAFMQMSTSGPQAKEVIFGDVKARINYSPWFQNNYPYAAKFTNQLRFEKDVWILPGDSAETTFEGYNIMGGILDEADSHKVTKDKDYADQGYTTIHSRVESRFGAVQRPNGTKKFGFLMIIGQMKKGNGFAAKKYDEFKRRPDRHAVRMAIWESLGWDRFLNPDGTRDSFWYDANRKEICSTAVADLLKSDGKGDNLIEVPEAFRTDFENNPEKALRDLAGIPPAVGSPFISLLYKIDNAVKAWEDRHGDEPPVDGMHPDSTGLQPMAKWFYAQESLKRVGHIDIAYSAEGDSMGIAMGHVPEMIEIEGERKPFIVIDFVMRIHAPAGREIFLGDMRRLVYSLKEVRHFNVKKWSMDGFESTDTRQQFEKKRYETEKVSVDKTILPYHDLREALYENRIALPPYMVRLRNDDAGGTHILYKELSELVDNGDKIDHPPDGSKDVADAVAGVCYTLMGSRQYHRRLTVMDQTVREDNQATGTSDGGIGSHPALTAMQGMRAPIPPRSGDGIAVWQPPTKRL